MLLFGGSDGCSHAFAGTWVFDGVTWQQATVAGPTARHLYAMAFDELRDEFVLFGGLTTWNRSSLDPAEYSSETWSYGEMDADGDGVPDDEDDCPDSDLDPEIVIDGCDTGVENQLLDDGCTMADLVMQCAEDAVNHGAFVRCVSHLTNLWKCQGFINGGEKGAIVGCAGQSSFP